MAGWDGTLKLWSFAGESLGGVAHPDGDRNDAGGGNGIAVGTG